MKSPNGYGGCLLLCKDRNFKANHNNSMIKVGEAKDVCYSAKIGILKQITTSLIDTINRVRCLLLCKDRNFKANHNSFINILSLVGMFVTLQR